MKSGETGTAHLVCGRRAIGNKAEAAVAGDSRHLHQQNVVEAEAVRLVGTGFFGKTY